MENKNLAFKMVAAMVIISLISGTILAWVWSVSAEKIQKNETKKTEAALFELNPNTTKFEIQTKAQESLYVCYNATGNVSAYFFLANGNGFQGNIKAAVAVTPDWQQIIGIRILEQTETPGLGSEITKDYFYAKFKQLVLLAEKPISYTKGEANPQNCEIRAITGATISSRAVVNLLNNKISALRKAGF